jgi:hypothetical protein
VSVLDAQWAGFIETAVEVSLLLLLFAETQRNTWVRFTISNGYIRNAP